MMLLSPAERAAVGRVVGEEHRCWYDALWGDEKA